MKRTLWCALVAAAWAAPLSAQGDPTDRLRDVLPADVAAQVLERIDQARARELPARAMANVALEGVAKGRSADEVLAALDEMVGDMGRAQEALRAGGRTPEGAEIEAATAAMRMGVDGGTIQELARSQPSGRSLAVPMLVLASLAERGLPSDEALAAVAARMAARADDAGLLGDFPEVGRGRGMPPGLGGPGGPGSVRAPVAGGEVPVGPSGGARGRPPNLPGGRGRGRGGGSGG